MTVIAYRDGVMAADSRSTIRDTVFGEALKAARHVNGFLCGGAGADHIVQRFLEIFSEAQDPLKIDFTYGREFEGDGRVLMATPTRELFTWEYNRWVPAGVAYAAIGCGWQVAIGAMDAGADAVKAVAIACKRDVFCGFPVIVLRHDGSTETIHDL